MVYDANQKKNKNRVHCYRRLKSYSPHYVWLYYEIYLFNIEVLKKNDYYIINKYIIILIMYTMYWLAYNV